MQDSYIGTALIKIKDYSANLAPRQVIETPILPAYNDLQNINTKMQSVGYGRDKYSINCYTTSYTSFATILNYWKTFTQVGLYLYVQNVTIASNVAVRISNFSYSVSTDDIVPGLCKYNMQIELITN